MHCGHKISKARRVLGLNRTAAPPSADYSDTWKQCKQNHARCNSSQIQFLQDFKNQMLDAIKVSSISHQNGLFINSCFAHCQSEKQETWFADNSSRTGMIE
uniref:Pectin acetylesterase n=1 Tax=Populus trichocarpa TaxID=3694 RepID=A0A2K2BKW8_POPTR